MLISLITPTHRPDWLPEAYRSLLRQSHRNWEWLLVPNGGSTVPHAILRDPRVRVVPGGDAWAGNVGALKRLGFEAAAGTGLVEFDHDDLLMPGDSLARVAELLAGGAGFVYSDTAPVLPNLTGHRFNARLGWEHYLVRLYGRSLWAARNFALTPRSLCEVYYAPDHLRAWHRDAYRTVGGHDRELVVGDDHDLICRTYLAGIPFAHTGGCHYVYRLHRNNTFAARGEQIRQQNEKNRRKYLPDLISEWARRKSLPVLDVADLRREGWRYDRDLHCGFGADDSLGALTCRDSLQFCPPDRCAEFMNACWRALRPGGYLTVAVYSAAGRGAWLDQHALSRHDRSSFLPYTDRTLAARNPEVACRFQLVDGYDDYPDAFHREHGLLVSRVVLCALKGQRQPGEQRI